MEEKGDGVRLTLVRGLTKEQRNVLDSITSRGFIFGSWQRALDRRERMLREGYARSDIPETDPEGRMAALRDDLEEALRDLSLLRAKEFPREEIHEALLGIGCANACDEVTECETEIAAENRRRHGHRLVDALFRAAIARTGLDETQNWFERHGRPIPDNYDLLRIALAEINADRIGTALPRVLVLPNARDRLKPALVWVGEDVQTDADTAECLRILFSR